MDPVYLSMGLLLAGGVATAELTCTVFTVITSYSEYKDSMREYGEAMETGNPMPEPRYGSIFWKNLKDIHAVTFGKKKSIDH